MLRMGGRSLRRCDSTTLRRRQLTAADGPWTTQLLVDDDGEYFCRVLLQSDGVRFVPDSKVFYRASGASSRSYIGRADKKLDSQWRSMEFDINYLRSLVDNAEVSTAVITYLSNIC